MNICLAEQQKAVGSAYLCIGSVMVTLRAAAPAKRAWGSLLDSYNDKRECLETKMFTLLDEPMIELCAYLRYLGCYFL